jgi:hypothetical protein
VLFPAPMGPIRITSPKSLSPEIVRYGAQLAALDHDRLCR